MKKIVEEMLRSRLCESLRKNGFEEKNGWFVYEIFADYDDRIDDKTVDEILTGRPDYEADYEEAFYELIESFYDEYRFTLRYEAVKDAMKGVYPKDAGEEEEMVDFLTDLFDEITGFIVPTEHYLDQEYCVDLMIDTGDGNYEYACNSVYPHYYGEKGSGIEDVASLVWLARTQGYSKAELEHALDEGDIANPNGFLETVRQEVANETSGLNCLTFLVKMTLKDLIKLNELHDISTPNGMKIYDADARPDCGTIKISKEAEPGLYDPWNGAGSVFEIQLEKDIELPIKYIRSCLPDAHFRWSVKSVYAIPSSGWKDVITEIKAPSKVTKTA